jgi:hypothetical protein
LSSHSRPPPATEAYCGFETITALTKILSECGKYGLHLGPKSLKVDIRGEKRYLEIIKENFQKAVPKSENSKVNLPDDDYEDQAGVSTHENSVRDCKKPAEVLQIEEEYNALT